MKSRSQHLQLLVIDDEQTTANQLIQLLKKLGIHTNFHLLDDREEFNKAIRSHWDVILFGHAYDFDYQAVIDSLIENNLSTPVIAMPDQISDLKNDQDISSKDVVNGLDIGLMDVIPRQQLTHIAYAVKRELLHSECSKLAESLSYKFKEAEQRAQLLVKNSKSAVAYIHDGVHIYTNETYNQLFGYHSLEDLIGQPVIDLIEGSNINSFKEFLKAYSRNKQQSEFKFNGIKADGTQFSALLQLAPASYDGESCIQIIIQPQLENSAALAAQLAVLGRVDKLTSLNNRLAFEEDLNKTLDALKKSKDQAIVAFISIDNIGHIHAAAGLAGSDSAIIEIANLLKQNLLPYDVYRFGESSYTTILKNASAEEAVVKANEICHAVENLLINIDKRTVQTTVSVGVVPINQSSPQLSEVLDRAYHAAEKVRLQNQGSGNGIYLYNPAENIDNSNSALRELLENAINRGQLKLMFQHIYDTTEEEGHFFEVYVRLPIGDGKLLTPDEFLAVAQQHQLEGRLDRWVLLTACKYLKAFMMRYPQAKLLINLGAESIKDTSLPEMVKKLITALGNPAHVPLVLQFSEANMSTYLQVAKQQLKALHQAGCLVSISDFGSSLNSKNILSHIDVDLVKLDKSFMQDLSKEENFKATQNIVAEVQQHNKNILASYIESTNDVAKAWSLGARYLQGYYFQKPMENLTLNNEEHV